MWLSHLATLPWLVPAASTRKECRMSLQEFVPTPRFADYREAFRDFFHMERRDDGVLLVRAHTLGGPVQLSVQNHRALGQMLKVIGADPDNEVLILAGSGEEFMMGSDP